MYEHDDFRADAVERLKEDVRFGHGKEPPQVAYCRERWEQGKPLERTVAGAYRDTSSEEL